MISHRLGGDTRLAFEWLDEDGAPVLVSAAELTVDGTVLYTLETGAPALAASPLGGVTLHLNDTLAVAPGNHEYRLRAQDAGGDWTILSAGLLRVRA